MRVWIRDTLVEDIPGIFDLSFNPEVLREQYAPPPNDSPELFAKRLVDGFGPYGHRFHCTSIFADQTLVGHVIQWVLPGVAGLECNCGWNLEPKFWGQGIMPQALKLLFAQRFQENELQAIVASCFRTNVRSQRVIEKLGFQGERMGWLEFVSHVLYSGRMRRLLKFRLTRSQWQLGLAGDSAAH